MDYIIDASVAAKWFLPPESGKDRAEELRKKHLSGEINLHIPELLYFEIANLLVTKKGAKPEEATESLNALFLLQLDVLPIDEHVVSEWTDIAIRCKTSAYDAIYVALAKRLPCPFITADRKLAEKVKKEISVEIV